MALRFCPGQTSTRSSVLSGKAKHPLCIEINTDQCPQPQVRRLPRMKPSKRAGHGMVDANAADAPPTLPDESSQEAALQ